MDIQSNPSIPPILGLAKKRRYSENGGIGVIYNIQNPYLDLENGRRYWEGGGIGRGAIDGDDCRYILLPEKQISIESRIKLLLSAEIRNSA